MFDDICLACGKFLDSGLVYCGEDCESADRNYSSPSLSSTTTSSVFTSPYISSAAPAPLADVPPLMLTPSHKRLSLGTSSSSASSDVNSVFEYDDDDDNDTKPEPGFHLPPLDAFDPDTVKVPNGSQSHRRPPVSFAFARRPSHADNRTLIPVLHRHASDTISTSQRPPRPQKHPSAPDVSHGHTLAHRHSRSHDMRGSTPTPTPPVSHEDIPKPKRSRASLPAYFSHLQLSSHASPRPLSVSSAINLNANTSSVAVDATPKSHRRHARVVGEQLVYEAARSLSGRIGLDRSASRSRGRTGTSTSSRVAVPGSHEERGRQSRSRAREDGEREEERRGRSRVVTPRVKPLDS